MESPAGLKSAQPLREIAGAGKANGSIIYGGREVGVWGTREEVELAGATVVVAYDDGKPAVTEHACGAGRIIHFTTYPGASYYHIGWAAKDLVFIDNAWGTLVRAPVIDAKLTLPVTIDKPVIEAPALYSAEGVAVVLLNWSRKNQPVTVTVAVDQPVQRVESAAGAEVAFRACDGAVVIDLPLAEVDVLSIHY